MGKCSGFAIKRAKGGGVWTRMEGPMKDDKGRPTRKALALRKWDC